MEISRCGMIAQETSTYHRSYDFDIYAIRGHRTTEADKGHSNKNNYVVFWT